MAGAAPVRSGSSPEQDVLHAAFEAARAKPHLRGIPRRQGLPDLPGEKLMRLGCGLVAGAAAIAVGSCRKIVPLCLGLRGGAQESRCIAHR